MNAATITKLQRYTVMKGEKVMVRIRNKEPQTLSAYQSETVSKGKDSTENVTCNAEKKETF